jgi:5-methylcytosine-specific restriction endonuclease McrA
VKDQESRFPPLPKPDSQELAAIVADSAARAIFAFLYHRRENPPTMREVEVHMSHHSGEAHTHVNRRLRALRESGIDVPAVRMNGEYRYPLRGWRLTGPREGRPNVNAKVRAQVLAPKRCAQCGKTPLEDGVKLVVDHKIPREWGGDDELENLQPMCEECNGGKRAWFATYDDHAAQIRAAINHKEVHRRIAALLTTLKGEWVYTELVGIVASSQAFQEDYQKRLRELREFGWVIKCQRRRNEGPRTRTYYKLVSATPLPDIPLAQEVRRLERLRRGARKAGA